MVVIIGIPNAGKSTYSERFHDVIHLDDFPLSRFRNCNKAVAKSHGEVVVEGIYNTRNRREELLKACTGNEKKVCVWIDTPLEVCLSRCTDSGFKHTVEIGARMFQPPQS